MKKKYHYFGLRLLCAFVCLVFAHTTNSQCLNYQVYESFATGLPTAGGLWLNNSVSYATGNARSGNNNLSFDGSGDFIRTPQIATPGIFSFWYSRSGNNAAHTFSIETSPDNVAWTSRGIVNTTPTLQQYSINLAALGLTNIYVRILDTRTAGAALRFVDDVSWTSATVANNLTIPSETSCNQTVTCGSTYNFTDVGGSNDSYNVNQNYTITFTPSVGTNKVRMVFSAFATEAYDGMIIYDGPSTASPIISSGLPAGSGVLTPSGSFYGTTSPGTIISSDATGSITIRFQSDVSNNLAGWIAAVNCISISPCVAPAQAASFTAGTITSSTSAGSFTGSASGYLVIRSLSSTPPAQPIDGTAYTTAANVNTLGTGLTLVKNNTTSSFSSTGLIGNTSYYYFIYAYNNSVCSGGPVYAVGQLIKNMITCPSTPSSVTVSGIGTNAFNLNWVAPTGGTAAALTYTIQVSTDAGFTTQILGSPFTVNAPTVSRAITGLSMGVTYYYQISANNGCSSVFVSGTTATSCSSLTIPYIEGFNNSTLSNCITLTNVAVQTSSKISVVTASTNPTASPNEGTRFISYSSFTNTGGGSGSEERLRTPPLITTGTTSIDVEFDWFQLQGTVYNSGNYLNEGVQVQWSTNGTTWNSSTFFPRHLVGAAVAGECSRKIITLPAAAGNQATLYIGLKFHSEFGYNCYVDNLIVRKTPTCFAPLLRDTGPITNTTATINWSAASPNPTNGYQYIVSTASTAPTGPGTAAIGLTANVTGLTANTSYYVYVRSNCGSGDFSDWSTSGVFFTGFCVAGATTNAAPYHITNFTTTGGAANILNTSAYTAGGYADYTSQIASQQPYGTVNFSALFAGGNLGFNIWIDWNNDMDFNDLGEKVYQSGTAVANASGSFTVPGIALVGNHRMRIRGSFNATNPSPCGNGNQSETEDYTFTVLALPCAGNPSNLAISSVGITTATINWAAASPTPASYDYYYASSGIVPDLSTPPSGNTTSLNATLSPLIGNTFYNVWIRSKCGGTNGNGVWIGPLTFTTAIAPPITVSSSICQGGSSSISATASCTTTTNLATTIISGWNGATDPIANRPLIYMSNSPTCSFDPVTSNYTTLDFQVNVTGSYTFAMQPDAGYDGMGYIVVQPFTPGVCGGTWIVGDDDGGPSSLEAQMTATLTAGVTYTLISTVFSSTNIKITDTYQWNIIAPPGGSITAYNDGVMQWYTAASGGTPIAVGSSFNPVGVLGSGITNTNTPGTTTFYAACSKTPTVRSATNFVVNGPTASISGSGSACAPLGTQISIAFTGLPPFTVTYTDGTTPVTVSNIMTSPYNFSVSPGINTTYSLTASGDGNCTGLAINNTGTASVKAKTWNGGSGSWSLASNWNPVGIPSATDCVVIPSGSTTGILGTNYNANALMVTVQNGGILQIGASNTLTANNVIKVTIGGQINIADTGGIVQVDDVPNIGTIKMERITKPMYAFDYTYWSSPMTLYSNFTLGNLSPDTRFDKYHSWIPSVAGASGNWYWENIATVMIPGKGYIVRAPATFSSDITVKTPYTANFIGTPNNGDILCPIGFGTLPGDDDNFNLLGNPYPSSVNATSFLNLTNNRNIIDGTIYFWTHNSGLTPAVDFYGNTFYVYNNSDYATWNLLGSTGTGYGTVAGTGGQNPSGFIAAGQSFFVRSSGITGNAIFKNNMRTAGNNNSFFKGNNALTDDQNQRLWLNLTSAQGVFSQILIGYAQEATNGLDWGYDGLLFDQSAPAAFYSTLENNKLTIQGRALPFDEYDRVAVGFSASSQGMHTIQMDHFDAAFDNQDIFVEDNLLNISQNLKLSPYTFATAVGTFNDRFVIVYKDNALAVEQFLDNSLMAFLREETINVTAAQNIRSIEIFDVAGKIIATYKLSGAKIFTADFRFAQGIYIAKFKLENGSVISQKLMNK